MSKHTNMLKNTLKTNKTERNVNYEKYNVKKNEFCDIILTSHKEGEKINEEKK